MEFQLGSGLETFKEIQKENLINNTINQSLLDNDNDLELMNLIKEKQSFIKP